MKKSFERVLIVDDDTTCLFLTEMMMKDLRFADSIVSAANGKEALEQVINFCKTNQCPDLILLDINMPIMNGFEFLEAIDKNNLSQIKEKVVVLTTSNNPKDTQRMKDLGVATYIHKPISLDKLSSIAKA